MRIYGVSSNECKKNHLLWSRQLIRQETKVLEAARGILIKDPKPYYDYHSMNSIMI
jgi:hypothetical protein